MFKMSDMTPSERLMLFALKNFMDNQGKGARPATSTLAAMTGMTQRNVTKVLGSLDKKGVIKITRNPGECSDYEITDPTLCSVPNSVQIRTHSSPVQPDGTELSSGVVPNTVQGGTELSSPDHSQDHSHRSVSSEKKNFKQPRIPRSEETVTSDTSVLGSHPMDQRFRPTGHETACILELQNLWATLWKTDCPSGPPSGDNMRRVLEALRHQRFGFEACMKAVRGHHKLAKADGMKMWRDFRHVFPALKQYGKPTARLDCDRFEEFIRAAGKKATVVQKEEPKESLEIRMMKRARELECQGLPREEIHETLKKEGLWMN